MPTQAQINSLKHALETRFQEVREAIRQELLQSDEQSYIDLAGRVHDLEEESVADLLYDVQLAHIDRHVAEAREIEAALQRIAQGTYGVCLDCGEPIPLERLEAYPTAKRCRACQARYENTHASAQGGGSL